MGWIIGTTTPDVSAARTTFDRILEDYREPSSGVFREYWSAKGQETDPAFNWSVGVTLSALNAMAMLDATTKPDLKSYLRIVKRYWNPAGPVPGFDVVPGPPFPTDRYYDDNAWMVMALVESYEITRDREWLNLASNALTHALSGADSRGGVKWRERNNDTRNTCCAAPIAAACLAFYKHKSDPSLIATAENLYQWAKENLQDPTDHLMWDNLKDDGKIDKTKWSYNTALMMRTAAELGKITGKPTYQAEYDEMHRSAVSKWLTNDGIINDEFQFAHLLYESLDPEKISKPKIIASIAKSGTAEGRFGKRWGQVPKAGDRLQLIHQSSILRMLALSEIESKRRKSTRL